MKEKKVIKAEFLVGERALFGAHDLCIRDTIFADGESPLKESRDIELFGSMFKWKYPLWYSKNISVHDCTWFDMARAGVWYTENISVENSAIEAPKNFRRCRGLSLTDVSFANAAETLWSCSDVTMTRVTAKGDYFAMNSENMKIDGLTLYGNYSFDGARNVRDKKFATALKGCLLEQRQCDRLRLVHIRRIPRLERKKSHARKLHRREPSGYVLYRKPCYEKLQAAQHDACL